jgi:hypothetical protein
MSLDNCQCGECEPAETFECAGCHREQPYCYGAADEFYPYCDDCVAEILAERQTD